MEKQQENTLEKKIEQAIEVLIQSIAIKFDHKVISLSKYVNRAIRLDLTLMEEEREREKTRKNLNCWMANDFTRQRIHSEKS